MSLTSIFQLNNYWWILIWPFAAGIFFYFVQHLRTETVLGKEESRWRPWAAFILVLPLTLWAGFRGYVGDTYAYKTAFDAMPTAVSEWGAYIAELTKDKGFSVFSLIIKWILGSNYHIYFLVLAVIQMACLTAVLRKFSCDYWLSIFLFIASTDYISWMYNGIRQFTAVTFIFAGTVFFLKKKYIPAILLILFASLFHQSALLMIPVIFIVQGRAFNKVTIICIIAAVAALFFADQFTDFLDTLMSDTQYSGAVAEWTASDDDGMNPLRVLVYSMPTILAIIGIRTIRDENNTLINFCVNASMITTALSIVAMGTSGIFIGRLPVYTCLYSNCILLPWEIENIFTKQSAKIVKAVAIVCYTAFFYYQMRFSWGLI